MNPEPVKRSDSEELRMKRGRKRLMSRQNFAQQASTPIEHRTRLNIYSPPSTTRMMSIVCTIGPKTASVETITALREAGMNIVRMNFSHGSHEYHASVIENTRKSVAEHPEAGRVVAIALDTKGPEVRTGLVENDGEIVIENGDKVTITTDPAWKEKCTKDHLYLDYKNLPNVVQVGGLVYIDDGLLSLTIKEIIKDGEFSRIETEAMNGGKLSSRKGVNLPEVDVDLPALSEKDKSDLRFGIEQGVDIIFASFIRKASDVREIREFLGEKGQGIMIISKIENHEGMRNFDEILQETDGIMVARGDLGIEIAPEKVFVAQKMMIAKCNLSGKPIICATQMLESMITNPRPTRAETSDVANAVLDGADCVMLSGETAKGKYPIESVQMMAAICQEAESAMFFKRSYQEMRMSVGKILGDTSEAVALAVVTAAHQQKAAAIITITNTGRSAALISKFRPQCPIIVASRDPRILRQIHLYRGCFPIEVKDPPVEPRQKDVDLRRNVAITGAIDYGFFAPGDLIITTVGWKRGKEHRSLSSFSLQIAETSNE